MNKFEWFNLELLSRSTDTKTSVLDVIYKMKIYNANPFAKDVLERAIDETKAGKYRFLLPDSWEEVYESWPFKVNILTVNKIKSGSVYMLDEFGDKDIAWGQKFFFTNEYHLYTRKNDVLWFKQSWWTPTFLTKEALDTMLKTKRIDGKLNPFYKEWEKADKTPYDTTHITESIIIYGKFLAWPFKDSYFKFVPVSKSWYGSDYDSKTKSYIEPEEGTFLKAMEDALNEWNEVREANGMKPVKNVDPSQVNMSISFRELEVKDKKFFIPTFTYDGLYGMSWGDNTEDLEAIVELQNQYTEEEFGNVIWEVSQLIRPSSIKWELVWVVQENKWFYQLTAAQQEELEKVDVEEIFEVKDTPLTDDVSIEKPPF